MIFRIAIVGRPNVGKSALFNRLAGRTVSIVHDQPGVTRDRVTFMAERAGRRFEFIDTGGIGLFETENTPREIATAVQMQVEIAIASADLLLLVVDGLEGVCPLDEEIVKKLRRSGRPLWLVVNKLDTPRHEARATEFCRFGIETVCAVSAAHSRKIDELWEAILAEAEKRGGAAAVEGEEGEGERIPRLAIVGRPNVGKSSLVNRLLGEERVIVSEIPGTTRDSVELDVDVRGRHYVLCDTAGIRHKTKIHSNVEMYSRHWTDRSIARCDVALLLISAADGPTRQDCEIASMIAEHRRACLVLVNKWDLNETFKEAQTFSSTDEVLPGGRQRAVPCSEYEKALRERMPFLDYAPVLFVSALQGYQTGGIWRQVDAVLKSRRTVFSTGILNRLLARAQERVQPPARQGRRLKIYYATQKVDASVPTFVLFVNQRKFWVESYGRYLATQLRLHDTLPGCPVIFELREREVKTAEEGARTPPRKKRDLPE